MVNAGISVSNAVSFMENEACEPQNLGFIRKDAYDHMSRLKKHTKVENGDATALIQYFINKANKDNYFYWNVQLDDDDRVMNFFFRDYRCENVLFGLAFMSDETQNSFECLFATFLDSMNGRQPQTIFSDQCQAMMNAIETIFPLSHHHLCQWHINQNAPSHFGSLNGDSAFKGLWYKCMNHCDSEDEFESTWKYMIETYDLDGHKWLNDKYKLKKRWSTAFMNGRFSAGLLATSRSEVTDMVLKKAGNKMSSLYEFVLNYAKIQNNWREREKTEDTRCRHGNPAQILKNHPLLINASNVYTICHKFETMGILCKHALMVFNCMDVTVIPECYILKRWMKNVRNRVTFDFDESGRGGASHVSEMVFVNEIMRSTYDLTQLSKSHEEARKILYGLVDTTKDEISNLVSKLSVDDETQCDDIRSYGVCIGNPLTAKAKGVTNVNITRQWILRAKKEKEKERRKQKFQVSFGIERAKKEKEKERRKQKFQVSFHIFN
ncbi:protein FAR-RED IMPAIRED RESPONSE 1-like [Primulina tabacum]|uniref:protein FAR-RED IMPAIRED RESPONSE 1-like n=1 Tax=Primulina tabacum TaxID=48773 RepID=UPI003F5A6692